MPLLSSFLLIQSSAVLVLALSLLLVTSPNTVLTSTTLSILGSSMHIRPATFIPEPQFSPKPSLEQSTTINPLAALKRSRKLTLTASERELLSLLGLVISTVALSTIVLSFPLRFSKSDLVKVSSSSTGNSKRRPTTALGESIAKLNLTQTTWQVLSAIHVLVSSSFVAWVYVFRSDRHGKRSMSLSLSETENILLSDARSLLANNVTFTLGMMDMLFWGYVYTTIKEERREVLGVLERRKEEDHEDEVDGRL